jgi:hypothetical protein
MLQNAVCRVFMDIQDVSNQCVAVTGSSRCQIMSPVCRWIGVQLNRPAGNLSWARVLEERT